MAKTKGKVTKADRVRKYLAEHPDAKPKQAEEALGKYGISAQYVSMVKMNDKKSAANGAESSSAAGSASAKEAPARRGRKPGRKPASAGAVSGDSILAAAAFVENCGGLSQARAAMEAVERIGSAVR